MVTAGADGTNNVRIDGMAKNYDGAFTMMCGTSISTCVAPSHRIQGTKVQFGRLVTLITG